MATKQQIPVLAARLTEFQEEFSILSNEDTQWGIMNGRAAASLCALAIANRDNKIVEQKTTETTAPVLGGVVCTSSVIPTAVTKKLVAKKFVVKDKFKVDTSKKAKVKISNLGDDFKRWFWGKIEEPFYGSVISGRPLEKNSVDGPIIAELGGHEKAETTIAEIYAMMERQPKGEAGDLMNNGFANIFYARDVDGILRAVLVGYDSRGWGIDARSIDCSNICDGVRRVFSRKPRN